jgi:hypothetical protein
MNETIVLAIPYQRKNWLVYELSKLPPNNQTNFFNNGFNWLLRISPSIKMVRTAAAGANQQLGQQREGNVTDNDFLQVGLSMVGKGWRQNRSVQVSMRRFRSIFGTEPFYAAIAWHDLKELGWLNYESSVAPKHLLWTLLLMKQYGTEELLSAIVDSTEKTFRKWTTFLLEGFAKLVFKYVSFVNATIFVVVVVVVGSCCGCCC